MEAQSPQRAINMHQLAVNWSPDEDRAQLSANVDFKVQSLRRNTRPLCSGDFLLSQYHDAATVTFCFRRGDEKFGVTVAHLADKIDRAGNVLIPGAVGDKVFAFDSDSLQPNGLYTVVELGEIVAIHRETDSLIFKVKECFEIAPLCAPQQLGMMRPFQLPTNAATYDVGTTLAGFGAQRRGAIGRVMHTVANATPYELEQGLLIDDMAIYSFDPDNSTTQAEGEKQITDDGDCGMLWFDDGANTWCMHHILNETHDGRFVSYGVPLPKVVEAHQDFFGRNTYTRQSSPFTVRLNLPPISQENRPPVDNVIKKRLHFNTEEVEAEPFMKNSKFVHHRLNIKKTQVVEPVPYSGSDKGT